MPRVRDLLLRFRPTGAPGPAGPAGVPVDRRGELADELAPVLAALAATEQECTAIVEQGRSTAARTRAGAATRADAVRAGAAARAEAEHAAAAAAAVGPPSRLAEDDESAAALATLADRAAVLAPRYLDEVAAAVEALCVPPGQGHP